MAGRLSLRYRLRGDLDRLAIPPPAEPARTDELWRHTCFEAFVGGAGAGYAEINVAPSGQWAAYRFDSYRAGMAPLDIAAPQIAVTRSADTLELAIDLAFDPPGAARLNLTTVIEDRDGAISYWAFFHPAGKPDFHAPDCLRLQLPAPDPS